MMVEVPVEYVVSGLLAVVGAVFGGGAVVGLKRASNGKLTVEDLELAVRKGMEPMATEMRRMREDQLRLLTEMNQRVQAVERDVGRILNGSRE